MPIRLKPREPSIISRADRARETRQWQLAADLYRVALGRNPRNPPIWVQYGHALKESGNLAEAEAAYRTAIGYHPDDADAHLQLGHVLKLQHRRNEAQAAYLQALTIDRSLSDAGRELARLGWTAAQLSRAADTARAPRSDPPAAVPAETATRRGRKRGDSLISRADRARDARQWPLAARLYRKALDRNPRNPPIWVQYGHALKESGRLVEAESVYRTAIAYDSRAADPHLQLGHVLKMQDRPEAAEAAYLRSFALQQSAPEPLRELVSLGWSDAHSAELKELLEDASEQAESWSGAALDATLSAPGIIDEDVGTLHFPGPSPADPARRGEQLRASGLFDPEVYLSLNPDLNRDRDDPWQHFLAYGLNEGRHFTSPEVVAQLLSNMDGELRVEQNRFTAAAQVALAGADNGRITAVMRERGMRVGVFCSSEGNFFMREIADLFAWGLQAQGIQAVQRDETASRDEPFDLRVFVAPHEFFWLGCGRDWVLVAGAANSVLYNVEQAQTQWFCRAFPLLFAAPLVLDINFHSAAILRRAGCRALHFMPGHLPEAPYAKPQPDASSIALLKGYPFASERYDWAEHNRLADRPIDILFIGSSAPRRDKALVRLQDLADRFRFLCVYTHQDAPLTQHNHRSTSTQINCTLAQRTKIVLNIHRDWLGYFEWSRIVLQGFWQGAGVVCDRGLNNPIFEPGVHYLEETTRHLGEMIRWLLETEDGREKLDLTRRAAHQQVVTLGSMRVALAPVLAEFATLLKI